MRETFNVIGSQLREWAWEICFRFGTESNYERARWGLGLKSFSSVSLWLIMCHFRDFFLLLCCGFVFLATPCDLQGLTSLMRNWTWVLGSASTETWPLDCQGIPSGTRNWIFSWPQSCVLVPQSGPTLCDPMDFSPPGSSVREFSRQEHWSGLPFPSPGDLPNPVTEPWSSALQADSLPCEPPGKSLDPQYLGND